MVIGPVTHLSSTSWPHSRVRVHRLILKLFLRPLALLGENEGGGGPYLELQGARSEEHGLEEVPVSAKGIPDRPQNLLPRMLVSSAGSALTTWGRGESLRAGPCQVSTPGRLRGEGTKLGPGWDQEPHLRFGDENTKER